MVAVTKHATTATVVSGTWGSTASATGSATSTYATWAETAANGTAQIDLGGYDFATSVPVDARLDSVTITVRANVTATSYFLAPQSQVMDGQHTIDALKTSTLSTSTSNQQTFTISGVTHAQLRSKNFRVRFTARRANVTTAGSTRLDLISVTANYTLATETSQTVHPWDVVTLTATGDGPWRQDSGVAVPLVGSGGTARFVAPAGNTARSLVFTYPGVRHTVNVNMARNYIVGSSPTALTAVRMRQWPLTADPINVTVHDHFTATSTNINNRNTPVGSKKWVVGGGVTGATVPIEDGGITGSAQIEAMLSGMPADGIYTVTLKEVRNGGKFILRRTAPGDDINFQLYQNEYAIYYYGPGGTANGYFMQNRVPARSGDVIRFTLNGSSIKIEVNGVTVYDAGNINTSLTGTTFGFRWDGAGGALWESITYEPFVVAPPTPQEPATTPRLVSYTTEAIPSSDPDKSIARPTTVVPGYMLVMTLTVSSGTTAALPAGFIQSSTKSIDSINPTTVIGYRIATDSEPESYTPTIPVGVHARVELACVANPGAAAPWVSQEITTPSATFHRTPNVPEGTWEGTLLTSAAIRGASGVTSTFDWPDTISMGTPVLSELVTANLLSLAQWGGNTSSMYAGSYWLTLARTPEETRAAVTSSTLITQGTPTGTAKPLNAFVRTKTANTVHTNGPATRSQVLSSAIKDGDLLLAFVSGDTGNDADYFFQAGSGWNTIALVTPGNLAKHMLVGYKLATSSDASSTLTVNTGTQSDVRIDVMVVGGWDHTKPPQAVYVVGETNATDAHSTPSLTPANGVSRGLLFFALTKNSGTQTTWSWAPPSTTPTTSEQSDAHANGWVTQMVASQPWESADPTGIRTFALTSTLASTALGITILVPAK